MSGSTLSCFAAVLSLLATFVFSWLSFDILTKFYTNGLGIMDELPAMFTDTDNIASTLNMRTLP